MPSSILVSESAEVTCGATVRLTGTAWIPLPVIAATAGALGGFASRLGSRASGLALGGGDVGAGDAWGADCEVAPLAGAAADAAPGDESDELEGADGDVGGSDGAG